MKSAATVRTMPCRSEVIGSPETGVLFQWEGRRIEARGGEIKGPAHLHRDVRPDPLESCPRCPRRDLRGLLPAGKVEKARLVGREGEGAQFSYLCGIETSHLGPAANLPAQFVHRGGAQT